MHAFSTIAAVLLAAAPAVSATGKVTVKNMCSYPVYLQSVPGNTATQTLSPNGGSYDETFRNVGHGGVSIKMSSNSGLAEPIMQYEYTLEPSKLWYDISNVNGKAFVDGGYSLLSDNSNCQNVLCNVGNSNCQQTYNVYNDDFATNACPTSASQVLVLCSGQDSSKTPSSIASSVASALFNGFSGVIGGGSASSVASPVAPASLAPAYTAPASPVAVSSAPVSPAVVEAAPSSSTAAYSPSASPVVAASSAPAVNHPQAAPQVTSVVASAHAAGPDNVYVTTMVTVYATETAVATATAEATVEPETEPTWFGHIPEAHGRTWNSAKNRRHMHHMHGHEAEEAEQS